MVLSLERLIEGCGYAYKRGGGKSTDIFSSELEELFSKNRSGHFELTTTVNFKKINPLKCFIVHLGQIVLDYDKYTKLLFDEYDVIIGSNSRNKDLLLQTYLYVKSFCFERKRDGRGMEIGTAKTNPVGCALSYRQIADGTGMAVNTAKRCVEVLCELKLLYKKSAGTFNDKNGYIRKAKNIYTPYAYKDEAKYIENKLREVYGSEYFKKKEG